MSPGVRSSIHLCLGDISRRSATEVQNLHSLVGRLAALDGVVGRVHVECSYAEQWADHGLLGDVPESIEVVAGIADVKSQPESQGALEDKIAALLRVLPDRRLLVSSSCACGRVPHDEAIWLMRSLVKTAGGG